ncbi:hypothetical protein D1P53_002501 [Cryptococcus gattii VGV]|nr:hypothetical protein D1P53_002501 [Cryptococcus gattii VGV]
MPPNSQTQKDAPLSEDPTPVGVEDDFKTSSLAQMQNAITYLSEVQIPTNNPTTMMPPKTKPVLEDSPENNDDHAQESSTAILLERLIDHTTKHDDTLALLTELLGKQQKQSLSKDIYTPQGIPLPKASDIPGFLGPLSDADKVLTHLHHLQQVLCLHGLLTQLDDVDMEE